MPTPKITGLTEDTSDAHDGTGWYTFVDDGTGNRYLYCSYVAELVEV